MSHYLRHSPAWHTCVTHLCRSGAKTVYLRDMEPARVGGRVRQGVHAGTQHARGAGVAGRGGGYGARGIGAAAGTTEQSNDCTVTLSPQPKPPTPRQVVGNVKTPEEGPWQIEWKAGAPHVPLPFPMTGILTAMWGRRETHLAALIRTGVSAVVHTRSIVGS